MSNTSNLDLERPDKGDTEWHTSLNSNMTKLDSGYGNNVATIADLPQVYIETGTFNFTTGDVITLPVEVDAINEYSVTVTPTTGAGGDIGFIYVTKTTSQFTVHCSANNTTDTFAAVIYYLGDINSYGGSIYRRWYVSTDAAITDHGDDTDTGSFAWVLDQIGATLATVELPGNKTYTITTATAVPANVNIIPQKGAVFGGAGTLTFDNPGQIISQPNQQIFGTSISVTLTYPGDIYPLWYPITADGATDDTVAFQQMVDGLADDSTIHIPEGTIILSNVESFDDVKIVGNKENCILKHKASASDHMLEMSGDVEIAGVRFDGNDSNQTGRYDVIHFDGGIIKIRDSYFTKSVKASIFVNAADEIDISHSHFIDIADHGGALNEVSSSISIQPSTNITRINISNNFFENPSPGVSDDLAAVGIYIAALSANCRDVTIHNNSFVGLGCAYVSNPQGVIDIYKNADRITITNNKFKSYYYIPIRVCDSAASVITGNIIQTPAADYSARGLAAIAILPYVHDTNAKYHCTISNNQILNHTVGTSGVGIYVSGSSSADTSRYVIEGNIIIDVAYGIYLEYVNDNVQISNNVIKTTVTDGSTYGVFLQRNHGTINFTGGIFDGFDFAIYGLGAGATINSGLEANITGVMFSATDQYDILLRGESGTNISFVKVSGCMSVDTDSVGFVSVQYVDEVLLEGNLAENKTINNFNNTVINSHGNNFANFYFITTLSDDATPSVADGHLFLTGGTTGITDFDGGVTGQVITIISEHTVVITDGTNIFLDGGAFTMTATDTLTLVCKADNKWYEVSRSDSGA